MSWFGRENPLRSSFGRRKSYRFTLFDKTSEGTCLEVFKSHWQQSWSIMAKYDGGYQQKATLVDDISSVVNLLDQMTTLLLQEAQHNRDNDNAIVGPILSFFLSEGCLDKLFNWSTYTGEFINALKLEQLKLYEVLISNSHRDLLFHKPVVRPLLLLLSTCRECCPFEVEKRLVILLNTLCVCITQFPQLLQVFFRASSDQGAKRSDTSAEMFLIFSLLIPFVHREGAIGQQARDALLLCMSLSRKEENIGIYIAEHSNFCPVLATGLSGLYSVLPRKLDIASDDWHCFTPEDIANMADLGLFLNSLEFCNAVIQVAHPMVQEQLLEYLYQGFLIPVLGPALHQDATGVNVYGLENSSKYLSTLEEIIATTAYLELFLHTITEPILLQVFLKFLLTCSHEGHCILTTLIDRLGSQGQLCLVTMALFHRLLDINCEDVLFQLVLRFLVPCSHIMVSQRSRIREIDLYSSSAEKFLALIPNRCMQSNEKLESSYSSLPPQLTSGQFRSMSYAEKLSAAKGGSLRVKNHHRSPSTLSFSFGDFDSTISEDPPRTFQSSYLDYLAAMHECVKTCTLACRTWSAPYDGLVPPPEFHSNNISDSVMTSNSVFNGYPHPSSENRTNKICNAEEKSQLCPSSSIPGNSNTIEKENTQESVTESSSDRKSSEERNSENGKNILDQLIHTEDESAFWNLISSTKTPSSVSDLDDSLEIMDACLKESEPVKDCDKPAVDILCTTKEENSNLDSGVFESRDSNSSSDRDNDSEVAVQNCAKPKHFGESLLLKKIIATKPNSSYSPSWDTFSHSPNVGPFLSILLTRLEMMMQNDVYTNLHLTGLISRLACYPQPLLRSFLLDHSLVFQPTVRSLLQVLGSLKHKVDSYSYTVENFDELVQRGRQFLLAREDASVPVPEITGVRPVRSATTDFSSELRRGEPRRRSLSNLLFRRSSFFRGKAQPTSREPRLESISDNQGYRFYTKPTPDALEGEMESVKTRNAVLCAIVLEEFLKEIAAISQEHSIIQLDPLFWDSKWQLNL